MKTTAKAQLRGIRMSPQKVRLLADLIRGVSFAEAIMQLSYSKKRAARPLKKLLESARANAVHNHHLEEKTLRVETITVDGGPILYRWLPRAMGRATPLRKRSSHITIVLSGDEHEHEHTKTETKQKKSDTSDNTVVEEVESTKDVSTEKKKQHKKEVN